MPILPYKLKSPKGRTYAELNKEFLKYLKTHPEEFKKSTIQLMMELFFTPNSKQP